MKSKEQKRQEAHWRTLRLDYITALRMRETYKEEVREGYVTYNKDDLRLYLRKWKQAKAKFEHGVPLELQKDMLIGWTYGLERKL